jgi:predicted AAA+ superfamily ATPase
LGIIDENQLKLHPLRGSLFETFVVSELVKKRTNAGREINLFYWRDKTGQEVDVIIDDGISLLPLETQSGKTVHQEFFKNILYWLKFSGKNKGVVLFGGDQRQEQSN